MKNKSITLITFSASVVLFIGASYFYFETKSFLSEAHTTEGSVIKLIRVPTSRKGDDTFTPVFLFKDQKGNRHRVESSTSSNPPAYSINEKVKIFYLENTPKEARIDSFFSLWGAATALILLSTINFSVGIRFLRLKH